MNKESLTEINFVLWLLTGTFIGYIISGFYPFPNVVYSTTGFTIGVVIYMTAAVLLFLAVSTTSQLINYL